jgi:hypothetical protein
MPGPRDRPDYYEEAVSPEMRIDGATLLEAWLDAEDYVRELSPSQLVEMIYLRMRRRAPQRCQQNSPMPAACRPGK